MKNTQVSAIKTLQSILLISLFTLGLSYLYAWTGPTSSAPNGNIALPINVSAVNQVKDGGLGVTNLVADTVVSSDITSDTLSSATATVTTVLAQKGTFTNAVIAGQGFYTGVVNLATMLSNGIAITSPKYCIGTDCITSWPTGGTGGGSGWENVPAGTTKFNPLCQYRWRVHPILPQAGYYYSTSVDEDYVYSLNTAYEDGGASVSATPVIKSVRLARCRHRQTRH